MRTLPPALWQNDGTLSLRGDSQALLFRTVQDLHNRLTVAGDPQQADLLRMLGALQHMLGAYKGDLPTATELLGDPQRERLAGNLLKG